MSSLTTPSTESIVLYAPKDIRPRVDILPPPGIDHAQLSVISTGLCGSDLHYYQNFCNGDFHVRDPLVLGHESSGIITALGPSSSSSRSHKHNHLRVGQRVAIEAGLFCRTCAHCKIGRYNLCEDMRFCSSAKTWPHLDGMLREKLNHPSYLLFPLPDNVSYAQAAIAEPLSVLIHAAYRASLPLPQISSSPNSPNSITAKYAHAHPASAWPYSRPPRILVLGAGPIGLLACLVARTAIEYIKEQLKLREDELEGEEEEQEKVGHVEVVKEKSSVNTAKHVSLKENYTSPRTRSDSDSTSSSKSSISVSLLTTIPSPSSPISFSSPSLSASSASESSPPSSVPTTPTTLPTSLLDTAIIEEEEEDENKERDEDEDEGLVAAIDINAARLSFALENGFADRIYSPPPSAQPSTNTPGDASTNTNTNTNTPQESATAALKALNEPEGFDIIFECSGARSCIEMGIPLARKGGKVILVGMGTREATIATSNLQGREVDVLGCFRYANTYPGALGLLSVANDASSSSSSSSLLNGETRTEGTKMGNTKKKATLADVEKLITHRFPLRETARAFELMDRGLDGEGRVVLKVVVDGPGDGADSC